MNQVLNWPAGYAHGHPTQFTPSSLNPRTSKTALTFLKSKIDHKVGKARCAASRGDLDPTLQAGMKSSLLMFCACISTSTIACSDFAFAIMESRQPENECMQGANVAGCSSPGSMPVRLHAIPDSPILLRPPALTQLLSLTANAPSIAQPNGMTCFADCSSMHRRYPVCTVEGGSWC